MNKAFFINGGAGRVLCSIPGLERFAETNDDFVIVSESWAELFSLSKKLRDKVYLMNHKGLFENHIKDKEVITLEPYRLNAYFNQKCNLIQAFDMQINNLDEVPETREIKLDLNKKEQITGHNVVDEVKRGTQKEKIVVIQPFGQSCSAEGRFISDSSGRSFEASNVISLIEQLKKNYGIIVMSQIEIPNWQEMGIAMPQNMNLNEWCGVINGADYFIGCDSAGQHMAHAMKKPATVIIGSTYPENISYPGNKNFTIIDNGKDNRRYSPIRMTFDDCCDRNNEDLMVLDDSTIKKIVKSVRDKIGVSRTKTTLTGATNINKNLPAPSAMITGAAPKSLAPSSVKFEGFKSSKTNKASKKKPIEKVLEMNNVKS